MSDNCLFCKIIAGEVPSEKIYEDEQTFAFLDIYPVDRGHYLIIPKEHADNLNSGTEEEAVAVIRTLFKTIPKVMEALGATGYNLGMNHGFSASQDIFHTHLHVIPRYDGEERSFVKTHPSQEELQAVADLIKEKI